MFIRQISIFIENRPGRLAAVTQLLGDAGVDIRSLSLADTRDFGILRLIVNKPDFAIEVLKSAGCTITVTNVVGVKIPDRPGGLADVLQTLNRADVAEYMKALESAPDLKAGGLPDGYKRLAEYAGAVFAGHETRYGVEFITWERGADETLYYGHYFGSNYIGANNLAKQGYNAYQILQYFYKNVKFARADG